MKISLLSAEEVKRINNVSLEILETVGMEIPHKETLVRLADLGADVDTKTHCAKMSCELVAACLKTAGKSYTLYGRDVIGRRDSVLVNRITIPSQVKPTGWTTRRWSGALLSCTT